MLISADSIINIVTVSLANVTINNNTVTHTIIITMKTVMRMMNAPVAKPPMNKPLTAAGEKELLVAAAGEKELFNLVASDCRELLQLVQSTATTPTSIPSTTKEKGA